MSNVARFSVLAFLIVPKVYLQTDANVLCYKILQNKDAKQI